MHAHTKEFTFNNAAHLLAAKIFCFSFRRNAGNPIGFIRDLHADGLSAAEFSAALADVLPHPSEGTGAASAGAGTATSITLSDYQRFLQVAFLELAKNEAKFFIASFTVFGKLKLDDLTKLKDFYLKYAQAEHQFYNETLKAFETISLSTIITETFTPEFVAILGETHSPALVKNIHDEFSKAITAAFNEAYETDLSSHTAANREVLEHFTAEDFSAFLETLTPITAKRAHSDDIRPSKIHVLPQFRSGVHDAADGASPFSPVFMRPRDTETNPLSQTFCIATAGAGMTLASARGHARAPSPDVTALQVTSNTLVSGRSDAGAGAAHTAAKSDDEGIVVTADASNHLDDVNAAHPTGSRSGASAPEAKADPGLPGTSNLDHTAADTASQTLSTTTAAGAGVVYAGPVQNNSLPTPPTAAAAAGSSHSSGHKVDAAHAHDRVEADAPAPASAHGGAGDGGNRVDVVDPRTQGNCCLPWLFSGRAAPARRYTTSSATVVPTT